MVFIIRHQHELAVDRDCCGGITAAREEARAAGRKRCCGCCVADHIGGAVDTITHIQADIRQANTVGADLQIAAGTRATEIQIAAAHHTAVAAAHRYREAVDIGIRISDHKIDPESMGGICRVIDHTARGTTAGCGQIQERGCAGCLLNRGRSCGEVVVVDGNGSRCIGQAVGAAACQRQGDGLWALHQQIIHGRDRDVDERLSGCDRCRAVENRRVIRTAGLPTTAGNGIAYGE